MRGRSDEDACERSQAPGGARTQNSNAKWARVERRNCSQFLVALPFSKISLSLSISLSFPFPSRSIHFSSSVPPPVSTCLLLPPNFSRARLSSPLSSARAPSLQFIFSLPRCLLSPPSPPPRSQFHRPQASASCSTFGGERPNDAEARRLSAGAPRERDQADARVQKKKKKKTTDRYCAATCLSARVGVARHK